MKQHQSIYAIKLGNRISICLRGNNLTHLLAAERFSCSTKTISRITNGTTDTGILMLRDMAIAFGIPLVKLVEE